MRSFPTAALAIAVAISFSRSTPAQVYDWINPAGGVFSNAANWSAGGPPNSSGETGEFGQPNDYTVSVTGNTNFGTLVQSAGNVSFDLNGWIFQPTNTSANGIGATGGATMRILDGEFRPGGFNIAGPANTTGTLILDADSETTVGSGAFYIGVSGAGTLRVEEGATLKTSNTSTIGLNAGSAGQATVSGTNSVWNANTTLRVGAAGTGTLNIFTGGVVTANALEVGEAFNSIGTVTVSGTGATFTTAGTANIGGATDALPAASATLNIGPAGTMNLNGVTNLRSGAKINVTGGTLNLNTLNFAPSADVNWNGGAIKFANASAITPAVLGLLLDNTQTLGTNRTLAADAGLLNITTDLILNGGRLNINSLQLNANLNVNAFSSINAAGTLTITAARVLQIDNFGSIAAATTLTNNGVLKMNGPLATVNSLVTNNIGTIQGTGRLIGGVNNGAAATIRAATGDHLIIYNTGLSNAGSIELLGGTVEYFSMLTNAASGFISGRGVFRGSSATPGGMGVTNNGVMAFSAGHTDIYGDVTNNATGRIVSAGGGVVTFYDDVVNQGDIRTNVGSRSVFFGSVTGAGSFTGGGDVELNGDLRPGNSPALVSFGGDVEIGPTGGLEIELGGLAKGTGYDALAIGGIATLSGALRVSLLNGYTPNPGDVFEIVTAQDGLDGAFISETLPQLGGGLLFDLRYEPTAVTLAVIGLRGDYNYDGQVNAADYILWRKSASQTGSGLPADGNHNGQIDPGDFSTWVGNYGRGIGNGLTGMHQVAPSVPEPGTALLVAIAALAAYARRARQRDHARMLAMNV